MVWSLEERCCRYSWLGAGAKICKSIEAKKDVHLLENQLNELLVARHLSFSDLQDIKKKLIERAILLKNKTPKSDWPLENLQRELEGVICTMNHMKSREMRAADGCKARNHLRSKLSNLKTRPEELMKLIEEQSGVVFTAIHTSTGTFPWQTQGYGKAKRNS
ncbi:hypothetical protein DAPPUDRAFT_114545 [Daphnia pulex]|uniref:Uncharacterized protein n=1 Tax=Daphnia pulex TaxID=6669 RepID=E9HII1_DAPPU|nr:hypothetical protein DAPPUDRAFT_114545 [Daphnia pulex]|eukprot:EFX68458.1 hypothetical protein DAPPUDRAFT_114545 [Daphnia pulex]